MIAPSELDGRIAVAALNVKLRLNRIGYPVKDGWICATYVCDDDGTTEIPLLQWCFELARPMKEGGTKEIMGAYKLCGALPEVDEVVMYEQLSNPMYIAGIVMGCISMENVA